MSTAEYDEGAGGNVTYPPDEAAPPGASDRKYIQFTLFYAIGALSFLGNLAVVVVIFQYTKMRRKYTNMYVINQSLIDGTAGLVLILSMSVPYDFGKARHGLGGELLCRLWATKIPLWGLLFSSTANLVALTLERFFGIIYPIRHKVSFTELKVNLSLAFVWISGPLLQILYKVKSSGLNKNGFCLILRHWPTPYTQRYVSILLLFLEFFIPLALIAYCYTRLYFRLKPTVGHGSGLQVNSASERSARARRNILKTLIIVCACFVVCWVWNQTYWLLRNLGVVVHDNKSDYYTFSTTMIYVNCCVNPVIYVIHYEEFRKGLHVLRRRFVRGSSVDTQNTSQPRDPAT